MNCNLSTLLQFPPRLQVKGETVECIKLANELKRLSLNGKLKCVWFHVSNENPSARKFIHWSNVQKAMGMIKGAPDYAFLWNNGAGLIEMKSAKGSLTEHQKMFKEWCMSLGVAYEMTRTAEDAVEALREWGVFFT